MIVVQDALQADDLPRGLIATIGNYDGIHRGQLSVLDLVCGRAAESGLLSAVITFDPHPLSILRPEKALDRLMTAAQKADLLARVGIDVVLIVRFTREFSATPARNFVRDFLHEKLDAREIYVGSHFVFGHRREGDLALLQEMGKSYGFAAFGVDEIVSDDGAVSSTRVRAALRSGGVEEAQELLGRPYSLTGIVTRGDRRGQELGWPTINLAPDNELLPADGVYACRVSVPGFGQPFDAVTNIGTRPTIYENHRRTVESHLLDFDADIYGAQVELFFYHRLRDERRFPTIMELTEQIARDVGHAQELLAEEPSGQPIRALRS